jgi:uncharacterized LabA/DUF88 family protein
MLQPKSIPSQKPGPEGACSVFIDGFNLYKGLLERRPSYKWLNLIALAEKLMPEVEIQKVFYFTANVKERFPGDDAPRRQQTYLRVLENQGIDVIRGKFRRDKDWLRSVTTSRDGFSAPALRSNFGLTQVALNAASMKAAPDAVKTHVYKMQEKGSDVNLASFLLRETFVEGTKNLLVITGDSDLVTPIKMAADFGAFVRTAIPNGRQNSDALNRVSSSILRIEESHLEGCLLPKTFFTPSGRQISPPREWR